MKAGVVKPEEALRYSLSLPIATAISGMQNREVLHKNVEIVKNFEPLSEEEKQEILNKTRQVAQAGEFEPFKTTRMFDGSVGRKLHGVG